MSSLVHTARLCQRRVRGWLGRAPWWLRLPAVLSVLAAAAVGISYFHELPLIWQVLTWALLAGAFVLLAINPVLFYDLIRSARRMRFVVIRTLYALLLSLILCWLFLVLCMRGGWSVPSSNMAEFATGFFYTFLVVQFVTVLLLTPAYTAGAISEEKERKTLEFMLATDLANREIVLGKLLSRLFNLMLLLLAGLPILSFLQFLGGVDPGLVLAGFAATAVTMFSVAGLSLLNSVMFRRSREAIVLTYLALAAYYLLASLSLVIKIPFLGLANFPSTDTWQSPVTLSDVVDWLNAGNVGYAVAQLTGGRTTILNDVLPGVLSEYMIFHGLLGLGCVTWAVLRLRVVALREKDVRPRARQARAAALRVRRLPEVGAWPMIWKEVYAEGGLRLNALGRIVLGVLVVMSFVPAGFIIYYDFIDRPSSGFSREMNIFTRIVGAGVGSLLLLAVVVRAASSITNERERDTFDGLLTTPLGSREIVLGKWLGAVLSVRWGWLWLALIWALGLVTGGLEVYALPLLLTSWLVYAVLLAGIGLWFSTSAGKKTLKATLAALVTAIMLGGGHWLLTGMFCYLPLAALDVSEREFEWMYYLQAGQTPPFVLALFAYHHDDFIRGGGDDLLMLTMASMVGVICWAAASVGLWFLVVRRFRAVTGRQPMAPPSSPISARPLGQPPALPSPRKGPETVTSRDGQTRPAGQDGRDELLWALPVETNRKETEGPPKGP